MGIYDLILCSTVKSVHTATTAMNSGSAGASSGAADTSGLTVAAAAAGVVTSVLVWGSDILIAGHADGTVRSYKLMGGGAKPQALFSTPPSHPLPSGADPKVVGLAIFGTKSKPVLSIGHCCGAVHSYDLLQGSWLGQYSLAAEIKDSAGAAAMLADLVSLGPLKALVGIPRRSSALQLWDLKRGKSFVLDLTAELKALNRGTARIVCAEFDHERQALIIGHDDGTVVVRRVEREGAGGLSLKVLRVAAPALDTGAGGISQLSFDPRGDVIVAGDTRGIARFIPRATGLPRPTTAVRGGNSSVAGAASVGGADMAASLASAEAGSSGWSVPFKGGVVHVHAAGGVLVPEFVPSGTGMMRGVAHGAPFGAPRAVEELQGEWSRCDVVCMPAETVGAAQLRSSGAPATAFTGPGGIVNGYSAHATWTASFMGPQVREFAADGTPAVEALAKAAGDVSGCRLVISITMPAGGPIASVSKEISARSSAKGGVTVTTTIKVREAVALPVGLPMTFRLPQGDAGQMGLAVGDFEFGLTAPFQAHESGAALAAGSSFDSLTAVPMAVSGAGVGLGASSAPVDLTSLPCVAGGGKSVVGALQLCGVDGQATVTSALHSTAVHVTWDALQLPSALLQLQRGKLVLVPCASAFDLGSSVSNGSNPLTSRGISTSVKISPEQPLEMAVTLTSKSV